jgi:hypothetical protein
MKKNKTVLASTKSKGKTLYNNQAGITYSLNIKMAQRSMRPGNHARHITPIIIRPKLPPRDADQTGQTV